MVCDTSESSRWLSLPPRTFCTIELVMGSLSELMRGSVSSPHVKGLAEIPAGWMLRKSQQAHQCLGQRACIHRPHCKPAFYRSIPQTAPTRSYAHTLVHAYTNTHIHTRLHAHTRTLMYVYAHTHPHLSTHTHTLSYAHTLMHACTQLLTYTYKCTLMHAYAHTHAHLSTHAHTLMHERTQLLTYAYKCTLKHARAHYTCSCMHTCPHTHDLPSF